MLTGVVAVLAFTRRPFRRDLAILAVLLPLFSVQTAAERFAGAYHRALSAPRNS